MAVAGDWQLQVFAHFPSTNNPHHVLCCRTWGDWQEVFLFVFPGEIQTYCLTRVWKGLQEFSLWPSPNPTSITRVSATEANKRGWTPPPASSNCEVYGSAFNQQLEMKPCIPPLYQEITLNCSLPKAYQKPAWEKSRLCGTVRKACRWPPSTYWHPQSPGQWGLNTATHHRHLGSSVWFCFILRWNTDSQVTLPEILIK